MTLIKMIERIIEKAQNEDDWPWVFTCSETGKKYAEPPESKPGEEPMFFWCTRMTPDEFEEVFGEEE